MSSNNSVLDLPTDLHSLRLNTNSSPLSLSTHSTPPALTDHHLSSSYDMMADNDMEQLSLEIEKERLLIY